MVVTGVAATIGDAVTFTRIHPARDPEPNYATTSLRKAAPDDAAISAGVEGGEILRLDVVKLGMPSNAGPSLAVQAFCSLAIGGGGLAGGSSLKKGVA